MAEWWESLRTLQQFFLYVAVPFTLVLIIQSILTIAGLGGHDADVDADADFDVDVDADTNVDAGGGADMHAGDGYDVHADEPTMHIAGFQFFTIRGLVAFFCIFGWSGYALAGTSLSTLPVILIATAAGLLAMLLIGLMFYSMRRLQASGNLKYSNAVGREAEVYLPIPALRSGRGKVMVTLQERLVEAEALTDDDQTIRTGETVQVVGNMGTTLIVKRQRR
jgi:membrane protein implicated in regulation of membrane protease activity